MLRAVGIYSACFLRVVFGQRTDLEHKLLMREDEITRGNEQEWTNQEISTKCGHQTGFMDIQMCSSSNNSTLGKTNWNFDCFLLFS